MLGLLLTTWGVGTALGASWTWNTVGNELQIAYGEGADKPQCAALHLDSGYFRLVPTREAGWGTSVVLTPCFWTGGQLKQGTAVTVDSVTEVAGELLLRLNATETGTAQGYSVRTQVDVTISPPTGDGLIQAHVAAQCTGHVALDDRPCEAFKPVMLSSMHISGTQWDARATLRGTEKLPIPANGWLLPPPCQAATRFGFQGGSSDWKQHAPTLEIAWLSTPQPEAVQGWVTASTDPNDDNLGFWAAFSALQPNWEYNIRSYVPTLTWLGTPGYQSDGVDPDQGGAQQSFTFRVLYRDPSGEAPNRAQCYIQRKDCGQGWRSQKLLRLNPESGDVATGAVYSGQWTLPNSTLKHRFQFRDSDGNEVSGAPAAYQPGPYIAAKPFLCWAGTTGYETDGVEPDTGPPGTTFSFQVRYTDAAGDAPGTAQVLVKGPDGKVRQRAMTPLAGGSYREGKLCGGTLKLNDVGGYQYRFRFADGTPAYATGALTQWQNGPNVTGGSPLALTGLAALPTSVGAQVNFALSAPARIRARVLNAAGRLVRVLCAGRDGAAGLNTLLWTGVCDSGVAAPAGLYLVEVSASGDQGAMARSMAPLRLRR